MRKNTDIFASRQFGRISLHMRHEKSNGEFADVQPLEFKVVDEFSLAIPFVTLCEYEAQLIMDQLWNVGIRPTEGSGSAGSLAATERHLADMKTIAFKLLEKANIK